MNVSNEVKHSLMIGIILVLLCALLFVYWIKPVIDERDTKEIALMEQKRVMMDMNWKVKRMQQNGLVERFFIASTRRSVPEEPRWDNLLHDSRSLELISGIPMNTYDWQEETEKRIVNTRTALGDGQVELIPLRLNHSFKSTFQQLSVLLQEIEDLPRAMVIKEMTISAPPSSPVGINDINRLLDVSMTIETYYAPALASVVDPKDELQFAMPAAKSQPFQ